MPVTYRQGVGRRGEALAARYLERLGMTILDRNVRMPQGEIDLVAREGDEVVIVEVKTRVGDLSTAPDVAVTSAKLGRLEQLGHAYVERLGTPDVAWRVDVVAVVLDRAGRVVRIDHVPGAYL
jgi:putative endonuclease